jgi:hypothetical protein
VSGGYLVIWMAPTCSGEWQLSGQVSGGYLVRCVAAKWSGLIAATWSCKWPLFGQVSCAYLLRLQWRHLAVTLPVTMRSSRVQGGRGGVAYPANLYLKKLVIKRRSTFQFYSKWPATIEAGKHLIKYHWTMLTKHRSYNNKCCFVFAYCIYAVQNW